MILVDYSGIAYACLFSQMGFNQVPTEDLIRHYILNSLRKLNVQFADEYGEMVICVDADNYWRQDMFPYYKAKRKEKRDTDEYDWTFIITIMNKLKKEIRENLPYKFIKVNKAEADDIIAVLSKNIEGYHIIVSNDKDIVQLMDNGINVYYPVKNEFALRSNNVKHDVLRFIMKGDTGDGIPNFLSDDDTFVNPEKRQKPLRETFINDIIMKKKELTEEQKINLRRNRQLIDLTQIPESLKIEILNTFNNLEKPIKNKTQLIKYFDDNKLRELKDRISDF